MSVLTRLLFLNRFPKKSILPIANQISASRLISTSKKNRDTLTIDESKSECVPAFKETSKNWISYGFDIESKEEDRYFMHALFFFGITVCCVLGSYIIMYKPSERSKGWTLREAYLELRRREKEGLPLVDPNYVPESQIILPSDEELGDTNIIV